MSPERFADICRAVGYRAKGMFYSEVFLFLQRCALHKVDTVVESGVKFGMSTALLRAAFDGELISIDKAGEGLPLEDVIFLQGDSIQLLPRVLAESRSRRLGILIDGPKGAAALALRDACMKFSGCRLVGVHDVGLLPAQSAHSWRPAFSSQRELFDRYVPEPWRRKYPMGPGLGIWEKKL